MLNIFKEVQENKDQYLKELCTFCSQPSIACENLGMDEMAATVVGKLNSLGAVCKVVSVAGSKPYILAELKAKTDSQNKKTVLIYNHYDVQPVDPISEWDDAPFDIKVKEDKVYGRGVADNKGDLLSRIQAIRLILETQEDLPVNIKWLIEGEEEIGSIHLPDLQKEHGDFWKDCDVCIWEDGWVDENELPLLTLGMKGILCVELECQFNNSDLHSRNAVVVDSPVWRLVSALSTLRDSSGNVLVDGFYEDVVLPTEVEQRLLRESEVAVDRLSTELGASRFLGDSNADLQDRLYFKGTANICGIWAGYTEPGKVKTIIPNKATAKLDFRLVANQNPADILQKIRAHLDTRGYSDILVKDQVALNPTKTDIDNEYVQKCLQVYKRHYASDPNVAITSLGGGPTYSVAAVYDIPVVRIGIGYPGTQVHAPNENIRIKDYLNTMVVLIDYLFEVSK